ncbi:hypothetical protein DLAC_06654 [Tieghemostelium lacteum]|uniref:Leucine-rich repeat-containing protein (LRR) n=1 Tax=Tieghemostelium lacteum TaxID=361077 RepID=A0A151ZFL7_TIELA|nr:hypothetical protein DLAC_06654 [Tieghemostelium lacteum]|eukprot:KYQ92660.1 hypothetical protein DLAC_06654 [Tieghemostelium lacteum]
MKLNSLEIICIDYLIANIKTVDFSKLENNSVLKDKILHRLLTIRDPTEALLGYIERLISRDTRSLDLSNLPLAFSNSKFRFLDQCKSLQTLTLTRSPSLTSQKVLSFVSLVGGNLKRLVLSQCLKINDSVFHYISYYCPQLEVLEMEDCISINGGIFQRATSTLPSVVVSETPSPSLMMKRMDNLLSLNLNGCRSIPSRNIYNLTSAFPNLKGFSFNKTFLSDEDSQLLIETLPPSIESLDLSYNPISRLALHQIALQNNRRFKLKSLCLGYCRCITAVDLTNLLLSLHNTLEHLSIPGCFQIDSSIFENLVTPQQQQQTKNNNNNVYLSKSSDIALRTLDISFCTQFTNQKLSKFKSIGCKDQVEILRHNNNLSFQHCIYK